MIQSTFTNKILQKKSITIVVENRVLFLKGGVERCLRAATVALRQRRVALDVVDYALELLAAARERLTRENDVGGLET